MPPRDSSSAAPDQRGSQSRVDSARPAGAAVALAFVGAIEGAVIGLAGQEAHDELLAARVAAGVLGLDGPPA